MSNYGQSKNFNKYSAFLVLVTFLALLSCEKDDFEKDQITENKEVLESEYIKFEYKYNYNDIVYNEKEWERFSKDKVNKDFSYIGINEMLYVFDDKIEAQKFANYETKKLESNYARGLCTRTGDYPVAFRLTFCNGTNLTNGILILTFSRSVTRNSIGNFSNNKFSSNLPSSFNEQVSSYRVEFLTTNSYNTSINNTPVCHNFRMKYKVYVESLEDLNVVEAYNYKIYRDLGSSTPSTSYFENLSNIKLIGALPLNEANSWNNKISSWRVEITN